MTMPGLAWLNLLRRPARTLLTILGIGLAVGGAVALLALSRGIREGVMESLDERGADLIVSQRAASDVFGGTLPETLAPRLAAVPGVANVAGEMVSFTTTANQRHVLVAGFSPGSPSQERAPLIAGRRVGPGDRRAVLLGDAVAETLQLSVGGTLEIYDERFTVVGIARWGSLMNRGLVMLPLAELQELSWRPGMVTGFHIQLTPRLSPAERERVREALAAVGPVRVSEARDVLARDRNVATLGAVSLAVSMIALLLGGLNVLSAQLLAVQERTREIGMIAAMGWSDTRIVTLIVLEGAMLGIAGCALGLGFGLLASSLFGALPAIGTYIEFRPRMDTLALPLGGALLVCIAGAIYPAWRAVRLAPAEALRHG